MPSNEGKTRTHLEQKVGDILRKSLFQFGFVVNFVTLRTKSRTGSAEVKKTQEEIAREVVARMLHEFTTRGLVEIRRGSIRLLDIEGLRKIG